MNENKKPSRAKGEKKIVYPTKRAMNLYFKIDKTTAPATVALYTLFVFVILLALGKVLIYDPLETARELEDYVAVLEQRSLSKMEELKDYDIVLKDYVRATPAEEQLTEVDRMQILDLLDTVIRPSAKISQITIEGSKVLVTFSGVTLQDAGVLVTRLEESPMVTNISVDTAASLEANQNFVEANVYFEVVRTEEAQQ